MTANGRVLDYSTLGSWLWEAACAIRGPIDAPRYKNYILPLVFLKRLSDVFDDEVARVARDLGDVEAAADVVERDHRMVRFYVPPEARWANIRRTATNLGEYLTNAVRAVGRANADSLGGVLDRVDYNETAAGQRIMDDARLAALVQVLSRQRLGLADVEPDILGRAYEYLLGKFAEGSGQSAGEFYTPRAVGVLMAHILDPRPGMTVYDPCCGSGGLLIKCHLRLLETHGVPRNGGIELPAQLAKLGLHGQEVQPDTYSLARMNTLIHDLAADIRLGDTMARPGFTRDDGGLPAFDLVTANPMWNQTIGVSTYENDPYNRFGDGIPPSSSADWGWVQHMFTSLGDAGCMAVVLDTGAVSRGSGNQGSNRERDIRKAFVVADRVEAVFLLPENLFVNTTAPGIVLVVNKQKHHPGEILLVNASKLFVKGRPKNELQEEHIAQLHALYAEWRAEEGLSAVITTDEAARNDYNLSPSRYVASNDAEEVLPLEDAVVLLAEAEEERVAADEALRKVLGELGLSAAPHQ